MARHWSEEVARRHLEGLGYRVVAENYSLRGGEVDLVALDGDVHVFVEVRQRRSNRFGTAADSLTDAKLERLRRAALHFTSKRYGRDDLPMRFDVVLIEGDKRSWRLEHLRNAF